MNFHAADCFRRRDIFTRELRFSSGWRNSCLKRESPPVSGRATIFFRNALRRSILAWIVSCSVCLAATTAPMYFTKLIPHFSQVTPVRCLLWQEGHSKRIVMWQCWQKRATSRTAAPHFGQGIVACGTGAAVGSQASARLGVFCGVAPVRAAPSADLDRCSLGCPEDGSLPMTDLTRSAG